MEQIRLFSDEIQDSRPPQTLMWNLWHGCTRVSPGCAHCYMFRKDEAVGRDSTIVKKTGSFNLPVRKLRSGEYKGYYKVPSGSHFFTCFSSDFFHKDADSWRQDAWDMIRTRSDCTFFIITKRPERILQSLPDDWKDGWKHVTIAVTCENQQMVDKRLPVYLSLPLVSRAVMAEPLLEELHLEKYLSRIQNVSVGGESGPLARPCDYDWVLSLKEQCNRFGVSFYYHQTGAKLIKDGREYIIPRSYQHSQAHKAGLDT